MLFLVRMEVDWPKDMDPEAGRALVEAERTYSQRLQRYGKWRHLWRIAGVFGNVSVFDVDSHDELHEILSNLPFFPYLNIEITPLARHPSRIDAPPAAPP
ncbi:Muconolactone Delta-isomerase [Roseivivax jejudonensis]|uniref:Muconolactone Delta-isomerase n=1 Tax=Roseivivax jejudonensis TaxID=1529041 RepID=A0A1X7A5V3_9RHOB|nr:muconolactone Delta-isomerase [Roseivivax jejudonensis]SLN71084.1 Muconolactone Delta-isomerase [Roseivivax jejudonensis]